MCQHLCQHYWWKTMVENIKVGWPTSGEAQTRTVSKMVESAHSRQIASQRKGYTWKFLFLAQSSSNCGLSDLNLLPTHRWRTSVTSSQFETLCNRRLCCEVDGRR